MAENPENPYVGPRPFERSDRDRARFFGRDLEARELLSLVLSERLVLFYAQSGAGKSSLINARLVHDLAKRDFFVLPVGRVSGQERQTADGQEVENVFVFSLLHNLNDKTSEGDKPVITPQMSLSHYLRLYSGQDLSQVDTSAVDVLPQILIIDQFEELFTTHPAAWEQREAFFKQVYQAMEEDPRLWVLLVMREDFLAQVDPYAYIFPGRLRARFYMQRLGQLAAVEAVRAPASLKGLGFEPREYGEGVAEELVHRLTLLSGPEGGPGSHDQFVEPLILQVVCFSLWEQLAGIPGVATSGAPISIADLDKAGDIDQALIRYYEDLVLRRVLQEAQQAGYDDLKEIDLRLWIEDNLITPGGQRSFVYESEASDTDLPVHYVQALYEKRLLNQGQREKRIWYELAHDRLVRPIRASNKAWAETFLQEFQRRAVEWRKQERPNSLLLRGRDLLAALSWAEANPSLLNARDRELLAASQEWREQHLSLLQRKAAAWERQGRPQELLLSQSELGEGEAWLMAHPDEASLNEMEYLTASRQEVLQKIQAQQQAELQRQYEQQRAEVLRRRNIWLIAASLLTSLALIVAIYFAMQFSAQAGENARQATQGANIAATNAQQRNENATQAAKNAAERDANGRERDANATENSANAALAAKNRYDLQIARVTSEAQRVFADALSTESAENARGRATAVYNANLARAGRSASLSQNNFGKDPPLSALLAIAAYQAFPQSWEGRNALLTALQVNSQQQVRPHGSPIQTQIRITQAIVFSPDGKRLAWCGFDGKVKVWDLERQILVNDLVVFPQHSVNRLAFSPIDSNLLISGSNNGYLTFWDLSTGIGESKEAVIAAPRFFSGAVLSLAISPNGKWLAVGGLNGNVVIWDLARRQAIKFIDLGSVTVRKLVWSPTGDRLAGAGYNRTNGVVYIWDESGAQVDQLSNNDELIFALDWSPNGEFLAFVGGDLNNSSYPRTVWLYALRTRKHVEISAQGENIRALAFDRDSQILAAGSEDGTLRLWDVSLAGASETVRFITQFTDFVTRPSLQSLAFTPQGLNRLAYFTNDNQVAIYDVGLSSPLNTELAPASSTGLLLASSAGPDGEVRTITQRSGSLFVTTVDTSQRLDLDLGEIASAAFGPGERIAVANTQGRIIIWDLQTGQSVWDFTTPESKPVALAFSLDGGRLALSECERSYSPCTDEAFVQVYEVGTDGQPDDFLLLTVYTGEAITSLAFSPDGGILAGGSAGGAIRLWEYSAGSFHYPILWDETTQVTALAFSPDGLTLASGNRDGGLALWDLPTRQQIGRTMQVAAAPISGLFFVADGLSLVSASQDGGVQRWDLDPGSWTARLCELAKRDFGASEFQLYFPGEPYAPACELNPQPTATPGP
jgi:WD40 repeat protein